MEITNQIIKMDSDNLGDADAEVYEKLEALDEVCKRYNFPLMCVWLGTDKNQARIHGYLTNENAGIRNLTLMLMIINNFFLNLFNNHVILKCSPLILEEWNKISEEYKKIFDARNL